jgi:hypothetical protein
LRLLNEHVKNEIEISDCTKLACEPMFPTPFGKSGGTMNNRGDAPDLVVPYGDTWTKTESFIIADGNEPSNDGDPRSVEWQLELSEIGGKPSHFVHFFEVQVKA